MINGFIDSYLLACPSQACTRREFDAYIASLLSWRDVVLSEIIPIYVSASAGKVLSEGGAFPPWQDLQALITNLRITEVHPGDVFQILQRFLDRLPKIEDAIGIKEILLDRVNCLPADHKRRAKVFADDFERTVGLICIFVQRTAESGEHQFVLSRDFRPCPAQIQFSADLADLESSSAPQDDVLPALTGEFRVFSCAENLENAISPELIWGMATSVAAYQAALALFVNRFSVGTGQTSRKTWRVGAEFLGTVERHNFKTPVASRSLLRACAETILDVNLNATHAIRENRGGNSGQVTRGNAAAWRRDIDQEYHLHYWLEGNAIIFAAVVVHNDFTIP